MPEVLKSPTPQTKRQSFSEFLESLDYGGIAEEATHELNELVHACTETGKAGEIVLAIKIKPTGKSGQVELASDVKVKKPKPGWMPLIELVLMIDPPPPSIRSLTTSP